MPASENGGAPTEETLEDFPLQLLYDANGATLDEDITLSYSRKLKVITTGTDDTIEISPGFTGTLTNEDTGDEFDFVATGSVRTSDNDDGTSEVTVNGLNLTGNPYLDADGDGDLDYALTQTRGHYSFTVDPTGATPEEIYSPLEGDGQILYIVDNFEDFLV
jgi:hypothetical protein